MNQYGEQEIRAIVEKVLREGLPASGPLQGPEDVLVEVSARHVHLTREMLDLLFGPGYELTPKKMLSQPGQYLSDEKVRLIGPKGMFPSVSILGPVRSHTQVELSLTDARTLGVDAPVNLSGNLEGAGDIIIAGPRGICEAKSSVIAARCHVHMTPSDAQKYGVKDKEVVSVRVNTQRPVTFDHAIVRVTEESSLAFHVDTDEANAAMISGKIYGFLQRKES